MYLKVMVFVILMLFDAGLGTAQNLSSSYTCNFAKIKSSSEQRTFVAVRTGAGRSFREIDRLRSGQGVYICDEHGDWFKIFYSAPDGPCGSASKNGLDVRKAKECRSGWVEKRWIDVISG